MSEEKKAIEFLKEIVLEFEKFNSEYVIDKDDKYGFLNSFKVVINVIEKQQKEIERLKFNNHMVGKWNEYLDKECISKDKIRELQEKVEKEQTGNPYDFIYMLQELLEENK